MTTLTLETLHRAVLGSGVGLRSRIPLEPLAGPGTKVFPPTYGVDRGQFKYALEGLGADRSTARAVVLDSVASQANRLEEALLDAYRDGELELPVVSVDFRDTEVAGLDRISALQAPHRIFDALLRDSLLDGVAFRLSDIGRAVTEASPRDAAAVFRVSPTTLLFGGWDSTGPKGGRGAKYERALTSEIVAQGIFIGSKTASRIDPAQIEKGAATLYITPDGDWTLDAEQAVQEKGGPKKYAKPGAVGEPGRPSQVLHGNITPSIDELAGGVTADAIVGTTVISFAALRKLRFPLDAAREPLRHRSAAEAAARTALAALGLAATVLAFDSGFDLRSRCVLFATEPLRFELLGRGGGAERFELDRDQALGLLAQAAAASADAGLPWLVEELLLQPAPRLVDLIQRSHAAAAAPGGGEE